MRTPFHPLAGLVWLTLSACGGTAEAPVEAAPDVPERCKNVDVANLGTDWVRINGSSADPKTRMRVEASGDGYRAYYIDGVSFTRHELEGVKRDGDVQFTEVPSAEKAKRVKAGEAQLVRLYVTPKVEKCALSIDVGVVDGKGKETLPPRGWEMVQFPQQGDVVFTYRPSDRNLFLGEAAADRAVAEKQLADLGGPRPDHEYGDISVGLWAEAAADGDAACTYDMDLYFDDRNVPELVKVPAGEVDSDGYRHWFHEWKAPYSGNHHFEFWRYRSCDGGERELIDVAGIEAVLN